MFTVYIGFTILSECLLSKIYLADTQMFLYFCMVIW
jgi:hypothetical protein